MANKKVIGVDLDGTLAHYDHWRGSDHIGKPIPKMYKQVINWIAEGHEVRIFTARASTDEPQNIPPIKAWLKEHNLPDLKITNIKGWDITEFYDDRAFHVRPNTGEIVR